jgi:pimeloyl-ACP methyl ester carboxylesterase
MRFHKPWLLTQRYGEIRIPTLVISGDCDRFVPVSHAQQLTTAIEEATLELWDDTGHLPHAEHPERFNSTVTAFLRQRLGKSDSMYQRPRRGHLGIASTIWQRCSKPARR